MTEPTDAELAEVYKAANGEDTGKAQPLTSKRIFRAMRAAIAKWGTPPAVAGEPFGYFHQLLDHEGNGNGVWLGTAQREVTERAHTPGETSEEIVTLYTTPQPTQAQAGAVPLTAEQITAAAKKLAECMEYPWEFMPEPGRENMRKHAQAVIAAANGIKGGQHG